MRLVIFDRNLNLIRVVELEKLIKVRTQYIHSLVNDICVPFGFLC